MLDTVKTLLSMPDEVQKVLDALNAEKEKE
jgi:hypothetical protein